MTKVTYYLLISRHHKCPSCGSKKCVFAAFDGRVYQSKVYCGCCTSVKGTRPFPSVENLQQLDVTEITQEDFGFHISQSFKPK